MTRANHIITGHVFRCGDPWYEAARHGAVWHAGTPVRFPEVIIKAADPSDVIAGVQLARDEGRQVTVRSGGCSWSGSRLRDGVVLLDPSDDNLRRLDRIRPQYDLDRLFHVMAHPPAAHGYRRETGQRSDVHRTD